MTGNKNRPPRPLSRMVFSTSALLLIPPLILILVFWIFLENLHFSNATESIRQEYLYEQTARIKQEVDQVYTLIDDRMAVSQAKLREELHARGQMAVSILQKIYSEWSGKLAAGELKKLLIDTFRNIRFDNDRDYYFVCDMQGNVQLSPADVSIENTNQIKLQDTEGVPIVQTMIQTVKRDGEGYVSYTWLHPKKPGNYHEKISYVVGFKPLGWFVGIGDYTEDFDQEVQADTLKLLGQFNFGTDGYVFVFDNAGTLLQNSAAKQRIGTNLWNDTDANGVRITQEILKTALQNPGGGWLRYMYEQPSTGSQSQKMSFVRAFPRWGWTIGTGLYLQNIDDAIGGIMRDLATAVRVKVAAIVVITVIMLFTLWFIVRRISLVLGRHVMSLGNYFQHAAQAYEVIPLDKLGIKEFEQIAEAANDMIVVLREQIREAQKQMLEREKMAGLGDIVGSATHEIGTPLGIGISLSSMLADRSEQLRQKAIQGQLTRRDLDDYLQAVQESSNLILHNLQRGAELMTGLKVIAVDQVKGERRNFRLRDYLDKIVLSVQPRLRATAHKIELDCPLDLSIDGNPGVFYQILTNLITNSIIHGFEGRRNGKIEIQVNKETAESQERVVLTYRDNGAGVPPDLAKRIFEPYFTTKKDSGGSGLGLHIVETLVREELRGTVEFSSEPGQGVSFTIIFPTHPVFLDVSAA